MAVIRSLYDTGSTQAPTSRGSSRVIQPLQSTLAPILQKKRPVEPELVVLSKKPEPIFISQAKDIIKSVETHGIGADLKRSIFEVFGDIAKRADNLIDGVFKKDKIIAPIPDKDIIKPKKKPTKAKKTVKFLNEKLGEVLFKYGPIPTEYQDPTTFKPKIREGEKPTAGKWVGGMIEDAILAIGIPSAKAFAGRNIFKEGLNLAKGIKTAAIFTAFHGTLNVLKEEKIELEELMISAGFGFLLGSFEPTIMLDVTKTEIVNFKKILNKNGFKLSDFKKPEVLKSKFRVTVKNLHPDKGGNAKEFDEFIQAYNGMTSAGVNSKWKLPEMSTWIKNLWNKQGETAEVLRQKANAQFKTFIEKLISKSGKTVELTPKAVNDIVINSNLQNTSLGKLMVRLSVAASKIGKNVAVVQLSDGAKGESIAKTPDGVNVGVRMVDPTEKADKPPVAEIEKKPVPSPAPPPKKVVKPTEVKEKKAVAKVDGGEVVKIQRIIDKSGKAFIDLLDGKPMLDVKNLSSEEMKVLKDFNTYVDKPEVYAKYEAGAKDTEIIKDYLAQKPIAKKPPIKPKVKKARKPITKEKRVKLQESVVKQIQTAETQEIAVKAVEKFVKSTLRAKNNKELKAIRAELNRQMLRLAGAESGNYKKDYAILQNIRGEPEISGIIDQIESGILEIDYALNPKLAQQAYLFKREAKTEGITKDIEVAKSPEALQERIVQLNKYAQTHAILRKAGGVKKRKAVGQFFPPKEIRLKAKYIANDTDYIEALSHELGHSVEYGVTGKLNDKRFGVLGDTLDDKTIAKLNRELKAVTHEIVGNEVTSKKGWASSAKKYYYKPSELFARFLQKRFVSPSNLDEIAPTANELLEKQSVKHPLIREYLEAADNEIDKGVKKFKFLPDLRQTYQKHLGRRVGNVAYDREIAHRAMQERAKLIIPKFIKGKFKGIKDDPATLFRAAEGIKVTTGGKPEFGTRDFVTAKNKKEVKKLKAEGWVEVRTEIKDGKAYPVLARARYTKQEAEAIFESLSDEGKQLIKDFTAEKDQAKDYFNREIIKDLHEIEGNVEGWVHHYFERSPISLGTSMRFKKKRAGVRAKRKGKEGYVENFQKAMTKVLVDLEGEKVYNDFIGEQFATVTRPIPERKQPDKGWVEVVGDIEKGAGLKQEKKIIVIKDGKSFVPKRIRYQMPKEIYLRYKLWRGLVDEASVAVRIVNDINRYWRINVLTHLGTAGTNMISGGIQFSTKVLTDFYMETLTGKVGYKKTRQNVASMLKVLLPKGWNDAPDWVYGSDLSNYYGQFTREQGIAPKAIQSYGNVALKAFGTYERYWKKVISTAENVKDLKKLEKVTKEGLKLPTKAEKQLIADINREINLYAYDYDNVPVWLEAHQKSAIGQAVKPFAKYPYKYAKHVSKMVGRVFDGTRPWQERMATLLALATVMGLYATYSKKRRDKQETPEPTERVPERLSVRGRLFAGVKEGRELFVRVAKYPFINLTQAGIELADGSWESAKDLFSEMVGSIGVGGKLAALAVGYRHDYDKYKPVPALLGENIVTFIPGFRVLQDISKMLDPYRRRQDTFQEAITKIIPTTNEDLQLKLHGEIRTFRVPIEGKIKKQPGEKRTRTTTDRILLNYWQDILLSMLTGIYITRIDPEEVKAIIIREEKSKKEKEEKENAK